MDPYDIASIFHDMEIDLIESQKRTLARHIAWEKAEGFEWEQWQIRKLEAIHEFRRKNAEIVAKYSREINKATEELLTKEFDKTARSTEARFRKTSDFINLPGLDDRNFFGINEMKMRMLIDSIGNDFQVASQSALRLMDDEYRQTIYRSQVYFSSGSATLAQSMDLASMDFLAAGIRSVQYANGARVNIASYAEMALRTQTIRTQMMAEGAVMDDWGYHIVKVPAYGSACPECGPWQGRILIDDVYGGGTQAEGNYPLMSTAIADGLLHPNCRHRPSPWFKDINEPEPKIDNEAVLKQYELSQDQRSIERNIRKNKRLEAGSIDPANKAKYAAKTAEWQKTMREFLAENPQMRREYWREKAGTGL